MKEDLDSFQRNREKENINHVNQEWFRHWNYHISLKVMGLDSSRAGVGAVAGKARELPSRHMIAFFCRGRALIFFFYGILYDGMMISMHSAATELGLLPVSCYCRLITAPS